MAYKKRYSKGRRKFSTGTKYVKQTFQSFFDFNTDTNTQILTISAGGQSVTRRLAPFFSAFKYAKLGKISIKMVPASTLPVDPTGMNAEVGQPGVDPSDQLTPGLIRITNGDTLSGIPSNVGRQRTIYNNMILDPRWSKFMLQSGVYKRAKPLAWQVANVVQEPYPDAHSRIPKYVGSTYNNSTRDIVSDVYTQAGQSTETVRNVIKSGSSAGLYQIGKNIAMGWLPTDALISDANGSNHVGAVQGLPEVPNVITIITPPANKTKYYYRCYVTETVYFKEPVANFPLSEAQTWSYGMYDRFIFPKGITTIVLDVDSSKQLVIDNEVR